MDKLTANPNAVLGIFPLSLRGNSSLKMLRWSTLTFQFLFLFLLTHVFCLFYGFNSVTWHQRLLHSQLSSFCDFSMPNQNEIFTVILYTYALHLYIVLTHKCCRYFCIKDVKQIQFCPVFFFLSSLTTRWRLWIWKRSCDWSVAVSPGANNQPKKNERGHVELSILWKKRQKSGFHQTTSIYQTRLNCRYITELQLNAEDFGWM